MHPDPPATEAFAALAMSANDVATALAMAWVPRWLSFAVGSRPAAVAQERAAAGMRTARARVDVAWHTSIDPAIARPMIEASVDAAKNRSIPRASAR